MSEELSEARRTSLDMKKKYQKMKEDFAKMAASSQEPKIGQQGDGTSTTIRLLPSTGTAPFRPKFVGGGFNLSSVVPTL